MKVWKGTKKVKPRRGPKKRRRQSSRDYLANVKVYSVGSPFTLRVNQLILGGLSSTHDITGQIKILRQLAIEYASKEVAALPADLQERVDGVRQWEEFPSNPLDPEVVRNGGEPYTQP